MQPQLPKPTLLMRVMPNDYRYGDVVGYTTKQVLSFAKECIEHERKRICAAIKIEEHQCCADNLMGLRKSEQEGWKEAAIAWEVCTSIHETWAKKKDALYSTRHADFERHAEDARRKLEPSQWFDEGRIEIVGPGVTAAEVQVEKPGGPNRDAPR